MLFDFSADRSDHRQKKQKVLMQNKSVQVGECIITAKDLTSDEPSIDYWKKLAETREEALNKSLEENEKLKEDISSLQQENQICKDMLEESRNLVEILKVILIVKCQFLNRYFNKYYLKLSLLLQELLEEKDENESE